jgi:dihydrofolate reductase
MVRMTLIATTFVSLNGIVEAPGGEPGHPHSGWVGDFFTPEGLGAFKDRENAAMSAQLLGRRTYESFAAAWPEREGGFADRFNAVPKHVVTSSTAPLEWHNSHRVEGALVPAVQELKERYADGELQVHGSPTLVRALLRERLLDELVLQVFPTIIAPGLTAFPETPARLDYELTGVEEVGGGVLVTRYAPRS